MSDGRGSGILALVGGGEWQDAFRELDAEMLASVDAKEVFVLPSAAAFERPERVVTRAEEYFDSLGVKTKCPMVLRRADADDPKLVEKVRKARAVYLADGSPLHLRSVLKGSDLWEAILSVFHGGGLLVASGASATLVCDPMVDPRGGAFTVGLGVVEGLAVFPYHGTAAEHLRERSIDLLPSSAKLVGIDDQTALIRAPEGTWRVAGVGSVSVYDGRTSVEHRAPSTVDGLP